MFRGIEARQLRLTVAIVAALFAGILVGRWQGGQAESRQVVIAGDAISHPEGQLVLAQQAASEDTAAPAGLAPGAQVDLNEAGSTQLELLPGVGPARAAAILEERERGGPFRAADELIRVPGIGEKTLERLRPFITVNADALPEPETAGEAIAIVEPPAYEPANIPPPPVRVNVAGPEQLQELKYVGPIMAERIMEHRARYGPFRRPEDMLRVNGIGPRFLEENWGRMRFD